MRIARFLPQKWVQRIAPIMAFIRDIRVILVL